MKKILIIEDDIAQRILLEHILKNYNCISVSNPEIAIEIFEKINISLVVMDLDFRSKEENGIKIMKKMKKIKDIPILAQTAYLTYNGVTNYREVGFDDFLIKPINAECLKSLIRKYLD
jgi:DNA-binding NtrC family response regulator